MKQILKRLELIKTSIDIDDEEIIELQVIKLEKLNIDNDVKYILTKIYNLDFGSAVVDIENYIKKHAGVVEYIDAEVQGLKLELKSLEKKLQNLSALKNEYLNDIHEFNIEYQLHLGETIQKILKLKEEILLAAIQKKKDFFEKMKAEYEQVKTEYKDMRSKKERLEAELDTLDEFDDRYDEKYDELKKLKDELHAKEHELNEKRKEVKEAKDEYEKDESTQEYEEVKKDHEEFSREYEEVINEGLVELNEEDKKELKNLYKKASKLCHPDTVTNELRDQATEIFKKLNDAYAKRDLKTVKEILNSLENGIVFDVASDTITDKEILLFKIKDLRENIDENEQDLQEIQEDETFAILQENGDLEEYFRVVKENLESQYENLKNSKEEVLPSKEEQSPNNDKDDYWERIF